MGNTPSSRNYDTPDHLAAKLSGARPLVLAFLSPSCGLCRSLEPQLAQVEASGLQVARLDSSDSAAWAPEMLAYSVEAVPCLVLLDSHGRALGKSTPPVNKAQMMRSLEELAAAAPR